MPVRDLLSASSGNITAPITVTSLGVNTNTSNSCTLTLGSSVPAGSLIYLQIGQINASGDSGTPSISDSAGNTYYYIDAYTLTSTPSLIGQSQGGFFYCYNCLGLSSGNTITVSWSNGNNYSGISGLYAQNVNKTSACLEAKVKTFYNPIDSNTLSIVSATPSTSGELFISGFVGACYSGDLFSYDFSNGWFAPTTRFACDTGARNTVCGGGNIINTGTSALTFSPSNVYGYYSSAVIYVVNFKPA